jgi:hypothetical protein
LERKKVSGSGKNDQDGQKKKTPLPEEWNGRFFGKIYAVYARPTRAE